MGVKLKQRRYDEYDLNTLQTDVSQAVEALNQADQPVVTVLQTAKTQALTGSEDYVLVDMSGALQDVYLLLPDPSAMSRALTVKVTAQGKKSLFVKGSDTGTVKVNQASMVQVKDSVTVVATPTQFYTI